MSCNYLALFDGAVACVGEAVSLQTLAVISANGSNSFVFINSNSVTK